MKYEECKALLSIDRDDLTTCLIEQPESYFHVAEALVDATANRDTLKTQMEEFGAELDKKIRDEAFRRDEKTTEASIQNRIKLDDKYQSANERFMKARVEVDKWTALKESFSQRSFMLRELVALELARRHDLSMEGGMGQARTNLADSNRKAAGQVRRERRLSPTS